MISLVIHMFFSQKKQQKSFLAQFLHIIQCFLIFQQVCGVLFWQVFFLVLLFFWVFFWVFFGVGFLCAFFFNLTIQFSSHLITLNTLAVHHPSSSSVAQSWYMLIRIRHMTLPQYQIHTCDWCFFLNNYKCFICPSLLEL